jgi:hypothetical protein
MQLPLLTISTHGNAARPEGGGTGPLEKLVESMRIADAGVGAPGGGKRTRDKRDSELIREARDEFTELTQYVRGLRNSGGSLLTDEMFVRMSKAERAARRMRLSWANEDELAVIMHLQHAVALYLQEYTQQLGDSLKQEASTKRDINELHSSLRQHRRMGSQIVADDSMLYLSMQVRASYVAFDAFALEIEEIIATDRSAASALAMTTRRGDDGSVRYIGFEGAQSLFLDLMMLAAMGDKHDVLAAQTAATRKIKQVADLLAEFRAHLDQAVAEGRPVHHSQVSASVPHIVSAMEDALAIEASLYPNVEPRPELARAVNDLNMAYANYTAAQAPLVQRGDSDQSAGSVDFTRFDLERMVQDAKDSLELEAEGATARTGDSTAEPGQSGRRASVYARRVKLQISREMYNVHQAIMTSLVPNGYVRADENPGRAAKYDINFPFKDPTTKEVAKGQLVVVTSQAAGRKQPGWRLNFDGSPTWSGHVRTWRVNSGYKGMSLRISKDTELHNFLVYVWHNVLTQQNRATAQTWTGLDWRAV